ncbi:MAG TPA: transglycosylase SLT domain-containing protein, partial [Polyangiaceae bacterium]|nr:transglycosylase SLT domain-containing protein [Polyangiaceae bacterium]
MRKPAFYALVAGGCALPLLAAGVALTRPGVRAALHGFWSPVVTDAPVVRGDGGLAILPSMQGGAGTESMELHAILLGVRPDGGTPSGAAPAPPPGAKDTRPPRKSALFEGVPPGNPKNIPVGLKRSDLSSRDDKTIDTAIATLTQSDAARRSLTERLQRSGRYRGDVERILRAWKIPESLTVVALTEGGFSPTDAVGDAIGIWHMTPDVASAYGLAMLEKYDERRGVSLSTEGTAHYLADLHDRFGSWELALYAYAMGYRAAVADVAAHKATDFWASYDVLSRDGTDYVVRVLGTATVLGNLGRFGLDRVKLDDAVQTSDLEVPGGAPLAVVARAAGTSLARIRDLNPEYLSDAVPATKFAMMVHLPTEGLARAQEAIMPLLYSTSQGLERNANENFDWGHRNLPSADAGTGVGESAASHPKNEGVAVGSGEQRRILYRAREGDTLEGLSHTYGESPQMIVADNALDPGSPLKAGTLLTIRAAEDAGASPP